MREHRNKSAVDFPILCCLTFLPFTDSDQVLKQEGGLLELPGAQIAWERAENIP